jgi:hypothetical protein
LHVVWLEYAPLLVDERDALPVEREAGPQLFRGQVIVHLAQPSDMLEGGHANQRIAIRLIHLQMPIFSPHRSPARRLPDSVVYKVSGRALAVV